MAINNLLDDMRLIKRAAKIGVMREAARITCIRINECMKATVSGMPLEKLSAIGKYVYQRFGQCSEGSDYLLTPSTENSNKRLRTIDVRLAPGALRC